MIAIGTILLALPVLAQSFEQPFLLRIATRVVVFSIAAVALNLILSFGGLVSFMQGAFLGIGGYVIAVSAATAPHLF